MICHRDFALKVFPSTQRDKSAGRRNREDGGWNCRRYSDCMTIFDSYFSVRAQGASDIQRPQSIRGSTPMCNALRVWAMARNEKLAQRRRPRRPDQGSARFAERQLSGVFSSVPD
jgi:hypothetical protein